MVSLSSGPDARRIRRKVSGGSSPYLPTRSAAQRIVVICHVATRLGVVRFLAVAPLADLVAAEFSGVAAGSTGSPNQCRAIARGNTEVLTYKRLLQFRRHCDM